MEEWLMVDGYPPQAGWREAASGLNTDHGTPHPDTGPDPINVFAAVAAAAAVHPSIPIAIATATPLSPLPLVPHRGTGGKNLHANQPINATHPRRASRASGGQVRGSDIPSAASANSAVHPSIPKAIATATHFSPCPLARLGRVVKPLRSKSVDRFYRLN